MDRGLGRGGHSLPPGSRGTVSELERREASIVGVGGRQTDVYRCDPVAWAARVGHVCLCMCVSWRGQVHKAHAWPARVPSLLVTLLWLDLSLELGRNSRDTRGSPSISFLEWYRVSGCLRVGAPISGVRILGCTEDCTMALICRLVPPGSVGPWASVQIAVSNRSFHSDGHALSLQGWLLTHMWPFGLN